ncbi:hypothetical protein GYMLUDRAFT_180465 [Collybiopsis luxurians FD-317 M1]|uniref:Unplaced genomic scaffold GYMLUscaffold_100, whole genome shotgun sequence n=1 Tax=Collybiopsis luxurians FD-317 M1 TaxID=944289 RepID=A0A0D0BCG7_9AGAR|nr:hypothetical protein GYMLUDRAFT_180465 [Collybiopsis luxurians FD-317 M1]
MASSAESPNFLEIFPHEITLRILSYLDALTLVLCQSVCRFLHQTIIETADLVYAIELAIACQEDGTNPTLSYKEKLELLRNQQERWTELRWSKDIRYPMITAGLWELFGNVLAQNSLDRSLTFVQLPSAYRDIPERQWTVRPEKPAVFRDFGMDPSQDLLVLIEIPRRLVGAMSPFYHIHLQTMSTATKHPLAANSGLIPHLRPSFDPSTVYSIQISSEFLGILFHGGAILPNEFVIWEWKTGTKKLHLQSDDLLSFCFLSERHVLFSLITDAGVFELLVVDFEEEDSEKKDYSQIKNGIKFAIPRLAPLVTSLMFTIRSDPSPRWAPHSDLEAPFYASHSDEKLFVASLWLRKANVRHLTLVLTQSAFLSHLDSLGPILDLPTIPWEDWGPQATRLDESYRLNPAFDTWACYIYGTKLVLPERSIRTPGEFTVQLFDFNQRALRRAISEGGEMAYTAVTEMEKLVCDTSLCVTAPSISRAGDLFRDEVRTWLPYRWVARTVPDAPDFCSLMCSEDAVIVVDDVSRRFRVFCVRDTMLTGVFASLRTGRVVTGSFRFSLDWCCRSGATFA